MTVHNSKTEREYLVHVSIMYLVTFFFLIYAHQIQQQITELRSHIFYNFFHIQMFLTNKAILINKEDSSCSFSEKSHSCFCNWLLDPLSKIKV